MKPAALLKIFILFLMIIPVGVWGQDYSVTVDSGFVFIDGEYIEPPYHVQIKSDEIFINDKIVFENGFDEIDITKYDEYPEINLEIFSNNYDLENYIYKENIQYERWLRLFFLKKYSYFEAIDHIINFYKRLEFVDDVRYDEEAGILFIEYKNGVKRKYSIGFDKNFLITQLKYTRKLIAENNQKYIIQELNSGRVKSYSKRGELTTSVKSLLEIVSKLENKNIPKEYKKTKLLESFISPDQDIPTYFYNYESLLKRLKIEKVETEKLTIPRQLDNKK